LDEQNSDEQSEDEWSVSKLDRLDSSTSLFQGKHGGKGVKRISIHLSIST